MISPAVENRRPLRESARDVARDISCTRVAATRLIRPQEILCAVASELVVCHLEILVRDGAVYVGQDIGVRKGFVYRAITSIALSTSPTPVCVRRAKTMCSYFRASVSLFRTLGVRCLTVLCAKSHWRYARDVKVAIMSRP